MGLPCPAALSIRCLAAMPVVLLLLLLVTLLAVPRLMLMHLSCC